MNYEYDLEYHGARMNAEVEREKFYREGLQLLRDIRDALATRDAPTRHDPGGRLLLGPPTESEIQVVAETLQDAYMGEGFGWEDSARAAIEELYQYWAWSKPLRQSPDESGCEG